MTKTLLAAATVLAVVSLGSVNGHSRMTAPKPNSEISDSPSGFIDGPNTLKVPDGMHFDWNYDQNQAAYQKAFESQTKYKTLRDLVYDKFVPNGASTKECGFSAMTGTPQNLPTYVEYATGFSESHWGPCEVWCDNTRVFVDPNCRISYPTRPAKLPYDKAKCIGAKRLQTFWLALHEPKWQVYTACATLNGRRMLREE
jgi:hypothetical protein